MDGNSTKLAIIGCGPKALAIAAKAYILQKQGLGNFQLEIYDDAGVAGNWDGSNGFTDGEQPLGTAPEKDIGFPYSSVYGKSVDNEMLQYSWFNFLIDNKFLGSYVDRGKPHPKHRQWADYLRWVAQQLKLNIIPQRVVGISTKDEAFEVTYIDDREKKFAYYHGVILTGPGDSIHIGEFVPDISEKILDGRAYWLRLPLFRTLDKSKRIAVIGGGETAASIVVNLIQQASSEIQIDLINRHGTIFTRGESFHENQLYTNPDSWSQLDEIDKEDFIRRTDRGVFSVKAKEIIDQAPNVRIITGSVTKIHRKGTEVAMHVTRQQKQQIYYYDYIIVAVGFDSSSQLQMLSDHLRPSVSLRELRNSVDYHLRIPVGVSTQRKIVNLHVPNLASLAQGPGFPNLSCLGILSDRVLSAYITPPSH